MLEQIKDTADATALKDSLARPRFQTYRSATSGSLIDAARLYVLDAELRGALLELIHFAEIALRESCNRSIAGKYGPWWFNGTKIVLDDRTRRQFREAESKMSPGVKTPDRVVAQVSFGAWTDLLEAGGTSDGSLGALSGTADYEVTLWDAALRKAFAGLCATRAEAAELTRRIRRLRNRVAHHEPIVFGIHQNGERDPDRKYRRQAPVDAVADLRRMTAHLQPNLVDYLARCTHVDELLSDQRAVDALRYAKSTRTDARWL